MALEHMIAAMSCMISTCGDAFTPTLLKNSVISNPIDDVWHAICNKQASEFEQKFAQLLKSQQKTFDTLDSIEQTLNNLHTLSAPSGDVKKLSKRAVLAEPPFNCNGSVLGLRGEQSKNEFPSFVAECPNKKAPDTN